MNGVLIDDLKVFLKAMIMLFPLAAHIHYTLLCSVYDFRVFVGYYDMFN